jgi:alpha-tubulin suppressor-like RCC1 family protein
LQEGELPARTTPQAIPNLGDVKSVACGNWHSLALKNDGTVIAWGNNGTGQLGDGTNNSRGEATPVKELSGVVALAAGNWHNLALKEDGTIWAWGNNSTGQLGDGTTETRTTPVAIKFPQ